MKKLYLAEICKIKRMKMTYVAYIGILFSMIISSVQLLGRVQDATFEQLASMFTYNNVLLVLTANEYKLLRLFMENPNTVLSPEQILSHLWDCDENYIDNNSLTVYIRRLRTKIEDDPAKPQRIITVRRMGYKWNTAE